MAHHVSKKGFYSLFTLLVTSTLIYLPSLTNFFTADDFYNMRLVMGQSVKDVALSFLFWRREDFLFYRPLSTQFFFFLTKPIFGFNALGYHAISFIFFLATIVLIYILSFALTKKISIASLATFFYALSPTNSVRLAWISQIQELSLALFTFISLLAWVYFLKKKKSIYYLVTVLCFVLALMCKESAVMTPLLLSSIWLFFFRRQIKIRKFTTFIVPIFFILLIYLFFRLQMGIQTGEHYFSSFSPKSVANTFLWYCLLSLGLPEILINYKLIGPGFKLNSSMVNQISHEMPLVGASFLLLGFMIILYTIYTYKKRNQLDRDGTNISQLIAFGWGFFSISLIPHLFSPWHKFGYELTVPLYGISLAIGSLGWQKQTGRIFLFILIISYSLLSLATSGLERGNHWVFRGATIANIVFTYMDKNYPYLPTDTIITFVFDEKPEDSIYGVLQQLPQALAKSAGLQLYYNNPHLLVQYMDKQKEDHFGFLNNELTLSMRQFIPDLQR